MKMADDPNRDLLPIRDGSYIDTYRSLIAIPIDPRERHTVAKLDRDDLEDKYLRLSEECQELKKLSNSQDDKIKRLVTKLMRVSATPRTCVSTSCDDPDRNKLDILKMENNKLKDKIVVLRSQILSHRVLRRSPSQSRRLTISTSSRPTTCRSENGRIKTSACQNSINDKDDDATSRNYINKIGELEEQRTQLLTRISELEDKLITSQTENHKDKIAENVEYIRVWRQMKLDHDKLTEAEAMKKVLCTQIHEMKNLLEETTKNNGQIVATLDTEKKRLLEIDEQLTRSQENELREKDEQIHDLMGEMKIIQQHNSELINFSTKYDQVDVENSELKKKLSELMKDNQNLKSAFSNEQTNLKALQAANEQLMEKLQSTQSNIDNLTIQLKSVQNQHQNTSKNNSDVEMVKKFDKQTSTTSLLPTRESLEPHVNDKKDDKLHQSTQTDHDSILQSQHQTPSLQQKNAYVQTSKSDVSVPIVNKPEQAPSDNKFENGKNNLSRDEMLKLLDEAQINTPLNTQNAISVRKIEGLSPKNYANTNYRQSSKPAHTSPSSSSLSSLSTSHPPPQQVAIREEKIRDQFRDIMKQICKILKDYYGTHFSKGDADSMTIFRSDLPPSSDNSIHAEQQSTDDKLVTSSSSQEQFDLHDQNNNDVLEKTYNYNTEHSSIHDWSSEEKIIEINTMYIEHECEENDHCICTKTQRCYEYCECSTDDRICERKISYNPFLSVIDDINMSLQKITKDNRTSRYQLCKPLSKALQLETEFCCEMDDPMKDQFLQDYVEKIDKVSQQFPQAAGTMKNSAECKQSCPAPNERPTNKISYIAERNKIGGNGVNTPERYSPILLTNQEGLVEIHILSLKFSPVVENNLFHENGKIIKRSLYISCEFCNEESISTSTIIYPDLNFNSSCIYRVSNLDEFLNNISIYANVYLQLHIVFHKGFSYVIAHGKINVKDILIYPQNKLHYIVNMESLVPCYFNKKFGQLSLWIRLSCDTNRVKTFKAQKHSDESKTEIHVTRNIKDEQSTKYVDSQKSQSLKLSNKTMYERPRKNSKSDNATSDKTNSKSKPSDTHKNLNDPQSKKSSDSYKINTEIKSSDPLENPWQPWKPQNPKNENNTEIHESPVPHSSAILQNTDADHHKLSSIDDDGNNAIVIMIDRLKLAEKYFLFRNPNIHQLYIEYNFLGKFGMEYETVSVPIPKSHTTEMFFNYVKKFYIDEKKHANERNHLFNILSGNDNPLIQFNVVSEPLIEDMETEECIDVGHAHLDLRKYILNKGKPNIFLTVKNPENTESIGVLKISILGINVIRQLLSKSPTIEES